MKCYKCGKDFSSKVLPFHIQRCTTDLAIDKQLNSEQHDVVIRMDNPNMYKELSYNKLREQARAESLEAGKNPKKVDLIEALEINRFGQIQPEV